MFKLFLFLFLNNNVIATNNPFLPPKESVIVKDITDLNTAHIGDHIKELENKNKDSIKTIKSKMPELEAKIENWYILSAVIKNRNVCYIVKYPDEQVSNHKESRKPYIIISFIANKRYEISVSAGYKYRANSGATLSIDGTIFKLSANDNIAWSHGTIEDFNIIQSMMNSFRAMIRSESSVGTYAVDIYDLIGFSEAYNKMITVCKKHHSNDT